ncbi:MAG: hypothetical protein K2I70_00395 [Bacilli bacterium]|nr:hypothetical protein [Bacilli bacterium]
MKKTIRGILLMVILFTISFSSANALSFSGNGKTIYSGYLHYVYSPTLNKPSAIRIQWQSTPGKKLKVSLLKSASTNSKEYTMQTTISIAPKNGDVWYFLPRFDVSCPSDASYCIGMETPIKGVAIDESYPYYRLKIVADGLFSKVEVLGNVGFYYAKS